MSRDEEHLTEAEKASILLLEDSSADAELVAAYLEDAGLDLDIHRVWTRDAFVAAIGNHQFDAILADHVLPQFDGDTALELARTLAPDIPFIFVSGTLTEELAVQALKRGATDYVVKQRLQRLPDALRRALAEAQERRELQETEAALRESRERLQLITDSLPVLIAYVDRDQRYRFNNKPYQEWFGQGPEQLYGKRIADVVSPEAYEQLRPQIERVLAGERLSYEGVVALGDQPRHIHVDYIPEHRADGGPGGYYALIQDIGERKAAEAALRRSEDRFQLALSAASAVGTWDWDIIEDRVYTDAGFADLYSVDPEHAVAGAPVSAFVAGIHPDDRERVAAEIQQAIEARGDFESEYRLLPTIGPVRSVIARGRVYCDDAGTPVRFPGISVDITDRKRMENALRESEERWRGLFEGMQEGFVIGEAIRDDSGRMIDWRYVDANPALGKLTGLDPEHVIGMTARETIPYLTDAMMAGYAAILDTDDVVEFERYAPEFGDRWFDVRARRIGPDRFSILFFDITDRKAAEEEQRLTSERFLEAIDGTGSSMGALIRAKDWSETPLGPPSGWSTALRSSLGIGLNSAFPVCVYWGPEFLLLYNDPWSSIPGDKHPWALGRPAREAWADIWDIIGPMFQGVMDTGVAVHTVDGLLPMHRHGYVEECYFNYNVSPIYGEDGRVAGLFNSVIETSYRVIAERRADLLRRLADRSAGVRTAEQACAAAAEIIATDPADLPFCLLYLIERDDDGARAVLAAASGLDHGSIAAPDVIDLHGGQAFWPVAEIANGSHSVTVKDLAHHLDEPLVLEPWPEPIETAHVLPMLDATRPAELFGFLVAGISPRVALDETYRTFLTNVSAHVANGIANARIAEAEREAAEELELRVAETAAERDRVWQVSQDLLLIADIEGRCRRLNPAWAQQLGYLEDDLVGTSFESLVHPEDREVLHREFSRLTNLGAIDNIDLRMHARNDGYRFYSWTAVVEGDGFYASGRDVTARRELEEQLRQAQKMEAVGQLTGGIAHDFNNLLTVVSGNVDMAVRSLTAQGAMDARTQRGLDNAMKGANRAAALTQRLLAFSRRQPLAPKALDIDKLVQGMSDLLNRSLGELVRLEVVTAPGLWRAEVDPNQLESAILNLAVNARDAMPDGGTLTIETANAFLDEGYASQQAEVAPGQYVVIAVSDTGGGMSKETVAHVFEPFFTTKEVGRGTGLGLSMVYGFTKQSGGHIKIYSEVGEGTTVKLYLPRLMAEPEDEEPAPAVAAAENGQGDELILVVEDDDDVRAYTVDCLRELGYRVLEAHDGPSALRLLDREGPSVALLFTDVVMPGMSGRDLAEQAREREPALKVLFTSGYARNAIGSSGRIEAGVQIIAKPFTFAALAAKVRDVLDRGDTGRILVVEHGRSRRRETMQVLDLAGYVVEEAADATEALSKIRSAQGRYDGVVLHERKNAVDHGLLAEMRALHIDLPVLILADASAAVIAERYIADRCTHVLVPPYTDTRLVAALRRLEARCIGGEP